MPGISPRLPLISSREDGGYVLNKTMGSVISQNLKHLLLTNPGEKVFDIKFGCGLKSFLFNQDDSVARQELIGVINQQVARYMPYLNILNINTDFLADENKLFLAINYSVPSLSINNIITLDIVRN